MNLLKIAILSFVIFIFSQSLFACSGPIDTSVRDTVSRVAKTTYYLKPSEIHSRARNDSSVYDDRVRIGGIVVNEKIKGDNVDRVWRFHITDERGNTSKNLVMVSLSETKKDETLVIAYTGVVPDTFKAGGMAIVEGKYGKDGVFRADTLLAKCPSKYKGTK